MAVFGDVFNNLITVAVIGMVLYFIWVRVIVPKSGGKAAELFNFKGGGGNDGE